MAPVAVGTPPPLNADASRIIEPAARLLNVTEGLVALVAARSWMLDASAFTRDQTAKYAPEKVAEGIRSVTTVSFVRRGLERTQKLVSRLLAESRIGVPATWARAWVVPLAAWVKVTDDTS